MNQINIIGAPVAALEPRTITTRRTNTERTVLDARIVVPRGGRNDPKDYFPVVFFGKTAELVARYSGPGQRLGITGRLELQTWGEGDDRKYKTVIIAEQVKIIDWPRNSDDQADDDSPAESAEDDGNCRRWPAGEASTYDRSLFTGNDDHAAANSSYPEIEF